MTDEKSGKKKKEARRASSLYGAETVFGWNWVEFGTDPGPALKRGRMPIERARIPCPVPGCGTYRQGDWNAHEGSRGHHCAVEAIQLLQGEGVSEESHDAVDVRVEIGELKTKVAEHNGRIDQLERRPMINDKNADIAEWMPLADPHESVEKGDLVGLRNGKISRVHVGEVDAQCFIVSSHPMFVGNRPPASSEADQEALGRAVVMIGQAPVKTLGVVKSGAVLVPGPDGMAVAVTTRTGQPTGNCKIVALETSDEPGAKLVRCFVNAGAADPIIRAAPDAMRSELDALHAKLRTLEARLPDSDEGVDGSWNFVSDGSLDSASSAASCSDVPIDSTAFIPNKVPATTLGSDADLESLAKAHPCVRDLLVDFRAIKSSVRRWMREPAARRARLSRPPGCRARPCAHVSCRGDPASNCSPIFNAEPIYQNACRGNPCRGARAAPCGDRTTRNGTNGGDGHRAPDTQGFCDTPFPHLTVRSRHGDLVALAVLHGPDHDSDWEIALARSPHTRSGPPAQKVEPRVQDTDGAPTGGDGARARGFRAGARGDPSPTRGL